MKWMKWKVNWKRIRAAWGYRYVAVNQATSKERDKIGFPTSSSPDTYNIGLNRYLHYRSVVNKTIYTVDYMCQEANKWQAFAREASFLVNAGLLTFTCRTPQLTLSYSFSGLLCSGLLIDMISLAVSIIGRLFTFLSFLSPPPPKKGQL